MSIRCARPNARAAASDGGLALIVVGTRGAQIGRERGLNPDLVLPMATHCAGVTGAARRVAAELYRMFSERRIAGVEVVYAQHAGAQLRTSSSIACCRSRCRQCKSLPRSCRRSSTFGRSASSMT